LYAADAGLLQGSGYGHSGQVANYQIVSNARSPRRELDRIFTNVQNSKSASLQHLVLRTSASTEHWKL